MATKNAQVNTLNIFLIIFSLILAFVFPFELFLLAYAILGPLHYVTEINWLEKKNFFSKNRAPVIILILLTALIAIPFTLDSFPQTHDWVQSNGVMSWLRYYSANFMFVALLTALAMVFTKNWMILTMVMIGSFFIGIPIIEAFGFKVLVGAMLPSIVHVYIFTMLFMLYGALKESSKLGYLSVVIMLIVPLIIIYFPIDHRGLQLNHYFLDSYNSSKFSNVNYSLGWTLGLTGTEADYKIVNNTGHVLSVIGLKIQIFIAFAYTYHYLNWFSKTTVIGWHKVIDKRRLLILGGIWLISIAFYIYNYYLGFMLLLFLSYLHVLMEFPLNWVTIKEIGKTVIGRKG